MDQAANRKAGTKLFTSIWRVLLIIVGALLGSLCGFVAGMQVAPLVGRYLLKPSVMIFDTGAIILGLAVMGLGLVGGAIVGIKIALLLIRRIARKKTSLNTS